MSKRKASYNGNINSYDGEVALTGVKVNNLKNISLSIPYNKVTVITGVSGSGKSSLAIDTIYADSQRRFLESLSSYAKQFLEKKAKPEVEYVKGMLPAIAITSEKMRSNPRSTVGTQSEINDYLRIIFSRISSLYCPKCGEKIEENNPQRLAIKLSSEYKGSEIFVLFRVNLDFNDDDKLYFVKDIVKQGFSRFFDGEEFINAAGLLRDVCKYKTLYIVTGRLKLQTVSKNRICEAIDAAYHYGRGELFVYDGRILKGYSCKLKCLQCGLDFSKPVPHIFSFNSPLGACPECHGFGKIITIDEGLVIPDGNKSILDGAIAPWANKRYETMVFLSYCESEGIPTDVPYKNLPDDVKSKIFDKVRAYFRRVEKKKYKKHIRFFLNRYRGYKVCPLCGGSRLKEASLYFKFRGKNIFELQSIEIKDLYGVLSKVELSEYERSVAGYPFAELLNRLKYLLDVGLPYLTLSREVRTLSGGELQRINMSSAIGAGLVDTLYILDEPSRGLHPKDVKILISIIKKLKRSGNTVLIIEHDKEIIKSADHIIELGPGAGVDGGEVIFSGTLKDFLKDESLLTAQYIKGKKKIRMDKSYLDDGNRKKRGHIKIKGAAAHNLKNVNVKIPLYKFTAVTGVSGSGKSSLIYDVLYKNFLRSRGRPVSGVGEVVSIDGLQFLSDMIFIGQSPVSKSARANPATFIGAFSHIRSLLAGTKDAKRMNFKPGHFSFNVDGGRCPNCKGDGYIDVDMFFLSDMRVRCEVCGGKRFKDEVLKVRYNGKNITDILDMTVDESVSFFTDSKPIVKKLGYLLAVGLGYIKLGQPMDTFSGGESQRLKLAYEMAELSRKNSLFIFDEPTVGLHSDDIKYLTKAVSAILNNGNTVIVIEHNMDIVKCADYVIELGPEGGKKGGEIIFMGSGNNYEF